MINLEVSYAEFTIIRSAFNRLTLQYWEEKGLIKDKLREGKLPDDHTAKLYELLRGVNERLDSTFKLENRISHAVSNQTGEDV
jgi:hypothetical protein